jgi:hypothetical protein
MYCVVLQEVVPVLFEDVSLAVWHDMWFSMMGHLPILGQRPNSISAHFSGRWIGCGSPVSWPLRWLDLMPLNLFVWRHQKGLVYRD